jgi:mannitol/fructose-specific phosphotransferase system IIA component (Ntr-type)
MKLSELMSERAILADLSAGSSKDALRIMVNRLVSVGILDQGDDALRRLVEREKVLSTALGGGIAIPHARTPEVETTIIALGRSLKGIPFDAPDGQPVTVLFLLLGPPESSSEHVRVLAAIARLARIPDFLDRLREATTAAAVLSVIRSLEDGAPAA